MFLPHFDIFCYLQCIMNKLLQKKTVPRYPTAQDNDILANCFADFFQEKISNLHQSLSARLLSADETPHPAETCSVLLHVWEARWPHG